MVPVLTYEVEVVDLQPQPTAVVRGHADVSELPVFLGAAFGDTAQALADQHLGPAGPPFACYVASGGGFDVEAGFPATGPVTPAGRVESGGLPGGQAARVMYRGDYAGVAGAYEAAAEWLAAHGYAASGPPWECYLDEPGVPEPRTVVYLPCRPL